MVCGTNLTDPSPNSDCTPPGWKLRDVIAAKVGPPLRSRMLMALTSGRVSPGPPGVTRFGVQAVVKPLWWTDISTHCRSGPLQPQCHRRRDPQPACRRPNSILCRHLGIFHCAGVPCVSSSQGKESVTDGQRLSGSGLAARVFLVPDLSPSLCTAYWQISGCGQSAATDEPAAQRLHSPRRQDCPTDFGAPGPQGVGAVMMFQVDNYPENR